MHRTTFFALCSFLSSACLVAAAPASSSEPIPPSKDPWYTAPDGFEKTTPGTVLRIRHAPGNVTKVVANSSAAYNILYRTTDSNYKASWAVTTLLSPLKNITSTNSSQSSLLSIQIAYNTASVDGSPSNGMTYALAQPFGGSPATSEDFSYALGKGWFVNTPDFEGPLASFGLGIQEGHATIDGVRAVLASGVLPRDKETKYALWGYSGGSIASGWAAELQEQYAPELKFAGIALGGFVTNFTDSRDAIMRIEGLPYVGLLPSFYNGFVSQNKAAESYLISRLKTSGPYNATGFLAARHYDVNQAFAAYAGQNVYEYFIGGKSDLDNPVLMDIINHNMYAGFHGIPQSPMFVYKAIKDEFTPIQTTDELMGRWCALDVNLAYERNTVGGHIAEITNGRLRALAWLETVFEGAVAKSGCVVKDVTVNLTSTVA